MRLFLLTAALLVVPTSILAGRLAAQPAPSLEDLGQTSDVGTDEAEAALLDRFRTCFEAETGDELSIEDVALLELASGELLSLLVGDECEDADCAEQLRLTSCESLADQLDQAMNVTPPVWAATLAHAMLGRVTTCLLEDTGRPVTPEEAGWLQQYRRLMARQYPELIALFGCTVDETAVRACTESLATIPCEDADPATLMATFGGTVTSACGQMFDCTLDGTLGDRGTEIDQLFGDEPAVPEDGDLELLRQDVPDL